MAAIVTSNQPGRMAHRIRSAFASRTLAGLGQNSGITRGIIDRSFDLVQSRFGTPPGTIVQTPEGVVIQRQASGLAINTAPPLTFQGGFAAPGGFAAALGGTTGILVIGGIVVFAMFAGKR